MTTHIGNPARSLHGEAEADDSIAAVARGIRRFIREDFDPRVYGFAGLLLIAGLAFNYGTDFTNRVLYSLPFEAPRFVGCLLMLASGYYLPALASAFLGGERSHLGRREFWIKSGSAIIVLAINFSLFVLYPIVLATPIPDALMEFALRTMASIAGTIVVGAYALGLKVTFDRPVAGLYGLSFRDIHIRPYLVLLLAVSPLIAIASFLPDFLHVYPTFRPGDAAAYLGMPNWLLAIAYEAFYLIDFLFVEIFFRGILVIGLVKLIGRGAVVPMTVLYTFAHFGKPFGEALAAILGGYVLGVIAYRNRSVIGGFVLHAGIAILMELCAAVQHWLRP
jgi:hypothetical protein